MTGLSRAGRKRLTAAVTLETSKEAGQVEKAAQTSLLPRSKRSARFWWASIIQGSGATALTALIVLPNIQPSLAQVMTNGGSAGEWLALGYVLYVTIGVLAVGLTALFYHHLEVAMNKPVRGFANYLAGLHLILMNVGVAAVCGILIYGGYFGGAEMLPTSGGGLELAKAVRLLDGLVAPASYALVVAAIGVLCGGLCFLATYLQK